VADDLEFCLLGPLVVRSGGALVPMRQAKQRVLLATLLLAADRVVPVEALAEALWGSVTPPSARNTVRNYVKRLRDALGEAGRARISSQPGGYSMRVSPGELVHALLMLALYRDGRQAEALAAYQHAYRVLADELAAVPGTELRELHHRILAGEAALGEPVRAQREWRQALALFSVLGTPEAGEIRDRLARAGQAEQAPRDSAPSRP